jgi:hypothetical protein
MKNLFAQHISEIGQKTKTLQKYAKGNVIPQTRMSIDQSATLFNQGTIGAGREDFWIIAVDKNGTNRWKPLQLKDEFAKLKRTSFWVFDGTNDINFCINKEYQFKTSGINNFYLSVSNNLTKLEIEINFKGFFGLKLKNIGVEGRNANTIFSYVVEQINENGNVQQFLDKFMPKVDENGIDIIYSSGNNIETFLYEIASIIDLAFSLQNKIYKQVDSSVNLSSIKNAYELLKLSATNNPNNLLTTREQIEELRQKFLANPIIDNLPPYIKGIAINEQIKQGNKRNEFLKLGIDKGNGNFDWRDSSFGSLVWINLDNGSWDENTLLSFGTTLDGLLQSPPMYVPQNQDPNATTPIDSQTRSADAVDYLLKAYTTKFNAKPINQNLPPYIRNLAKIETENQKTVFKLEKDLMSSFVFEDSKNGQQFWRKVVNGDWDFVASSLSISKADLLEDEKFPAQSTTSVTPSVKPKEEPISSNETKMPITSNIKSLEEEYEDVMFLIEVTPKVDIVAVTELKQRAYDLKKQIDLLQLKRTDELMQSNNIFQKLFESSSVEPIYRYDLTPDPNGFAPDGTPTTLPKTIYELCQTNDFLDWFGNFKNAYNYRNSPYEVPCSIVRTEHYEPKVVFHGTGAEFSYFDFNKFPAMYFAENFSYAEWFAEQKGMQMGGHIGYVYPFLLNIRNYLDLTDFGINEISFEEFSDAIFLQTGLDSDELEINPALISSNKPVWAWVYLRNSPEFLKKLRDMKLFDGIIYYEQNPPINPTAPNYMTKGFIIFEPQNAKIVATNRKELLLPSMRSFYLKKGGKV